MLLPRCAYIFLMTFAVSVGGFSPDSQAKTNKDLFSSYDIEVPFTISQAILPVNLLTEQGIELVVIGVDEQHQRWLAVYVFDDITQQFTLFEKHKIPSKYFAYDISDNEAQESQSLYFLARDEVVSFQSAAKESGQDKDSGQKKVFVQHQLINSMYLVEKASFLSRKDFIQDLNDDGIDDIILPDFDQVNLWLSQCCGQLQRQTLPISTLVELDKGSITYNQQKLFFADFNFDHKQDIAQVTQGKIEYFPQLSSGLFSKRSTKISLNHHIVSLNWWDISSESGDNVDQSQLSHHMVEKIQDVNGDGITDIIVRFTQSSGVLDRTNDYHFYFGEKMASQLENPQVQLVFQQHPSTEIKADGTLSGLKIIDINQDEKFEVMLSSFELNLTNIIGALLSGGIDQDVMLFSLGEQGKFFDKPFITKEVELTFSLTKGSSGQPIALLADVNGDGLQDLLLSDNDDTLKVYLGKKGKQKFAKKPIKQKLLLPKMGENMQAYDVNLDGKQDFVMHYGRLDAERLSKHFTVLLAH